MQKLSLLIKEATKIPHAQLEKEFVQRIRAVSDKTDYKDLLTLFFGFFNPLEKLIHSEILPEKIPDLKSRRQSGLLAKDIQELGDYRMIKLCETLPEISNYYQALGALYVMEGSTLGGQIIKQMLMPKIDNANAFHFFTGYGDETQAMWQTFRTYLDDVPENEWNVVITAANNTFEYFKNWIVNGSN